MLELASNVNVAERAWFSMYAIFVAASRGIRRGLGRPDYMCIQVKNDLLAAAIALSCSAVYESCFFGDQNTNE